MFFKVKSYVLIMNDKLVVFLKKFMIYRDNLIFGNVFIVICCCLKLSMCVIYKIFILYILEFLEIIFLFVLKFFNIVLVDF